MRRPETVETVACAVAEALESDREAEAIRIAFGLVQDFDKATPAERRLMVENRPPPTGDARYDALLAALVEHLCTGAGMPAPRWVDDPDRFLEPWWFVSGLRSLHASALVESPISFARRGVFICDGALSYA
jgi:hypothetical protein